jgi:hypothetical protein
LQERTRAESGKPHADERSKKKDETREQAAIGPVMGLNKDGREAARVVALTAGILFALIIFLHGISF